MRQKAAGFTLMEVMITVAIVAILASLALTSYRSQIVRSNRSAAQSFMLEVAGREERFLLDNRQYALVGDLSSANALGITTPTNVSGNYTIAVADDGPSAVPGYLITATPINAQYTDDTACGNLTLDSHGAKDALGSGPTTRCWQ